MTIRVQERRKVKKLDITRYNHDQIVDALLCPVNRHMTRVEHGCNDKALWENGGVWLMEHYINFGGAAEWAKRRERYEFETEELITREISIWVFLVEKISPHLVKVRVIIERALHSGSSLCHTAVK